MTASNTRGLDLMTQRGPLEPYTPNDQCITFTITIGPNLIVYFFEQVKVNSTSLKFKVTAAVIAKVLHPK